MSNSEAELYTPLEVADHCSISRRRIYDWIAAGWLRGHRIGGRWVVSSDDLSLFRATCVGAEGHLMPQLWEWDQFWNENPSRVSKWIVPPQKRKPRKKRAAKTD
jgi:excisionase family DNA binding protein